MDWAGWALFGLLATAVLTAIMISLVRPFVGTEPVW